MHIFSKLVLIPYPASHFENDRNKIKSDGKPNPWNVQLLEEGQKPSKTHLILSF